MLCKGIFELWRISELKFLDGFWFQFALFEIRKPYISPFFGFIKLVLKKIIRYFVDFV